MAAAVIAISIMAGVTAGCGKKEEDPITLPPTSVLAESSSWGVVESNFLRLHTLASLDADVLTGIPRGMIVEILSRTELPQTIDGKNDYWYRVAFDNLHGWVFGGYLSVHPSRRDAERHSQVIK